MPSEQRVRQRRLLPRTGLSPGAGAGLHEALRDEVVGQDHELLDELVRRGVRGLPLHLQQAAGRVAAEGELAPLQYHSAADGAEAAPRARELREQPEVPQHVLRQAHGRRPGCQGRVHLAVVEARVRADDAPAEAGRVRGHELAPAVEGEEDREGQAVALWKQGAEVLAQPPWQHGIHLPDQVHGRRTAPCLGIRDAAWLDESSDVCDVDADAKGAR
mmetsp:Transcript_58718/g.188821  ORF Transcript_58718/g.188821 Transcript_58718/m.188821 type:complete len:217 (-) Transcript_58718:319-969(-)